MGPVFLFSTHSWGNTCVYTMGEVRDTKNKGVSITSYNTIRFSPCLSYSIACDVVCMVHDKRNMSVCLSASEASTFLPQIQ